MFSVNSGNSNIGNLEPKSELIISFFFKVALKATVTNSDSRRKA